MAVKLHTHALTEADRERALALLCLVPRDSPAYTELEEIALSDLEALEPIIERLERQKGKV